MTTENWQPTLFFRFIKREIAVPTASFDLSTTTKTVRVLQQMWTKDDMCKWRDIPMEDEHDWQLVKEPVTTHEFYELVEGNYIKTNKLYQWDMHITLIDGVPQKEVEFR